jgi:O-antigen ligase
MTCWERSLLVISWLVVLALSTAGLLVYRHYYEDSTVFDGVTVPLFPQNVGPRFAANTFLNREVEEEKIRRTLEMLRAAGAGYIRQQFPWDEIERPTKGQYLDPVIGTSTWEKYDRIVQLAEEYGLEIIARVDRSPAWARPDGTPPERPPDNPEDYADFIEAFVRRYRGRIHYLQIWNEPNRYEDWGSQPVDPAGYVRLLKLAYARAKVVDPTIQILAAGLAPTIETGPNNLSELLYLKEMYRLGAKDSFDIMGAMAYGLFRGPHDRRVDPLRVNASRLLLLRAVMERYGDGDKPIWVSEFGWNALPALWQGRPSIWGTATPDQQARYAIEMYRRARREWPWSGPMALWFLRWPDAAHPEDPTPYFAAVWPDFTPRPLYDALVRYRRESFLAGTGRHTVHSAAATWRGPWLDLPVFGAEPRASARGSPASGASVRFDFDGTALELVVEAGPDRGIAYVTIDGFPQLAHRLPFDGAGRALLDLYAPVLQERRVRITDGIPPGPHSMELTVSGTAAPGASAAGIVIREFVVSWQRPFYPYALVGAAWLGTAAAAGWWLAGCARRLLRRQSCRLFPSVPAPVAGTLAVMALVLYIGAPVRIISAVALGLFGLAALAWPAGALAALLALIPFSHLAGRLGGLTVPALEAGTVSFAAAWLIRAAWRRELWPGRHPLDTPAALWLLAALVALPFAQYQLFAQREVRTVILEPLAVYAICRTLLVEEGHAPRRAAVPLPVLLSIAFTTAACLAAAVALGQLATGRGLVLAEATVRAAGPYPSPNHLGIVLDRALPVTMALAMAGPRRSLWLGAAVLIVLGLVASLSRGAWLGAAAGVLVVLALWRAGPRQRARRDRTLSVAVVLVAGGLVAAGAAMVLAPQRLASFFDPASGTALGRLRLWNSALAMLRDHLVTGVGPDNFLYAYRAYMHPDAWREPNLSHPHNLLLDAWLRLGIMGAVAVCWSLAVALRYGVRRAVAGPANPVAALWAGWTASLVALVVHGLVDNALFLPDLATHFWIAGAILAAPRMLPARCAVVPGQPRRAGEAIQGGVA